LTVPRLKPGIKIREGDYMGLTIPRLKPGVKIREGDYMGLTGFDNREVEW